jgi:hypothetical protein
MRLLPMARNLAGLVLATALSASCGIRLPIKPVPQVRSEPVSVSSAAPESAKAKDPHLLVWLVADKYHTGMVFPYDWLLESGFVPPKGFGNPRFVTMSWGNRNAYSKEGIDNYWKMFRVLFTPTPSVMEMISADWDVAEVCPHQRIWRKLVDRDCGPRLADFLNKCSSTGPDGRPIVVCPSSWGTGVQLESSHSYFIPRVCNVWTVQTIECLGGDINPWLALTADGLAREAEKPPNDFELIWAGGGMPPASIRNP